MGRAELGIEQFLDSDDLSKVSDAFPRPRRGVMGLSRRINLRLEPEQHDGLVAFGSEQGLRPSEAARLLLSRGLRGEGRSASDSPAALAALLAAEHAVLMVASVLPEGERRMRELGQRASLAAEDRLALFSGEREGRR